MKLNLGCGKHVKKDYINLDHIKLPGVNVVHDLNKFPYPFKNNRFNEIIANHVLEHLDDLVKVMAELHRICKPNAIITITVPYFHSHGAFRDPTHKGFFTPVTFDYFSDDSGLAYYSKVRFKVLKKELIPTIIGKFIFPKRIRNFVGLIFGEIIREIYFELKVVK